LGSGHWGNALFVSRRRFREQVAEIRRGGWTVLGLAEAVQLLDEDRLPPDALVLTIDDGWYGTYSEMLPVLADANLPFTLYAYTKPMVEGTPVFRVMLEYLVSVGRPRSMTAREIFDEGDEVYDFVDLAQRRRALNRLGPIFVDQVGPNWREPMQRIADALGVALQPLVDERVFHFMDLAGLAEVPDFGGSVELHTHMHRFCVDQPAQMRQEIEVNRRILGDVTTGPFEHFCYPSGVYDRTVFPLLSELGVKSATTVEPGFVAAHTPRLAMPRFCVGEQTDAATLNAQLSGLHL
jgi:peptidoglycan/xylan/chitin deacetylase (PgdA/CDA1 family)